MQFVQDIEYFVCIFEIYVGRIIRIPIVITQLMVDIMILFINNILSTLLFMAYKCMHCICLFVVQHIQVIHISILFP